MGNMLLILKIELLLGEMKKGLERVPFFMPSLFKIRRYFHGDLQIYVIGLVFLLLLMHVRTTK